MRLACCLYLREHVLSLAMRLACCLYLREHVFVVCVVCVVRGVCVSGSLIL